MKTIQPCSRVFDDDPHEPHTYYYGGRDVQCLGYSPLREPYSDLAETPEEFFTPRKAEPEVALVIRACEDRLSGRDHNQHTWKLGAETLSCYGYDSEIERLLWEEEVIEFNESHGNWIRRLFVSGYTRAEIAETLIVPLHIVDKIVEDAKTRQTLGQFVEEEGLTMFQRTVLWYENLRPIKKDLVMLAICVIVLTIWVLLLTAVLP